MRLLDCRGELFLPIGLSGGCLAVLEPSVRRKTEQLIFSLPAHTISRCPGFPPEDTEQLKYWFTNRIAMM